MALQSKVHPDLVSINGSNILALAVLAHCFPPTDDYSYLNMFIPYAASSQDELVKALLVTEVGTYTMQFTHSSSLFILLLVLFKFS